MVGVLLSLALQTGLPLAELHSQLIAESQSQQLGTVTSAGDDTLLVEPFGSGGQSRRRFALTPQTPVFHRSTELPAAALRPGVDVRVYYSVDATGRAQADAIEVMSRPEASSIRSIAHGPLPADSRTGRVDKIGGGRVMIRIGGRESTLQFDETTVAVHQGARTLTWLDVKPGCEVRVSCIGGSSEMPAKIQSIELLPEDQP